MSGRLKRCFFLLAGFLLLAASGCFRAAHVEGRFGEAGGNRYEVFLQVPYDFSPEGYFAIDVVPALYLNHRDLLNAPKLQVSSGGLGRLYLLVGPVLAYLNVWQSHWARAESTAGEKYYLEEVAWGAPGIYFQLPSVKPLVLAAHYDLYSYARPSNFRAMAGLWAKTEKMIVSLQAGRRSWSLDSPDAEVEGSVNEVGLRAVYVPLGGNKAGKRYFFTTLAVGYEWVKNQFNVASATPVSLDKEGTFISIGIGYGTPVWGLGLH